MPRAITKNSDEQLIELVKAGSHEAFSCLVKKYVTTFYYIAFKFVRSKEEAEDLVQDCFLKVWRDPHKFDPSKKVKFTTWFSRVVTNHALDHLKKRREEILADDFDFADETKNQLELLIEEKEKNVLERALAQLQTNQKQAIKLSFFENRKNQESAKIMGLSLKAFQSLLMRSKNSLRLTIKKS